MLKEPEGAPPETEGWMVLMNKLGELVEIRRTDTDYQTELGSTYIISSKVMVTFVEAENDLVAVEIAKERKEIMRDKGWKQGPEIHLR